jgi:hypothetical protein
MFLTRTKAFRRLTKWAFSVCDRIRQVKLATELYAGILLVHVQLTKYADAAACYPPTRQVIEQLFGASDDNNLKTIDEEESTTTFVVCCAHIPSRIFVYYALIILLVPVVADHIIAAMPHINKWMEWGVTSKSGMYAIFKRMQKILTWGESAEKIVSLALFMLLVPMIFDWIDRCLSNAADRTVAHTKAK